MSTITETEKHIREAQKEIGLAIAHLSSVVVYKSGGWDNYQKEDFDKLRLVLIDLISAQSELQWGVGN